MVFILEVVAFFCRTLFWFRRKPLHPWILETMDFVPYVEGTKSTDKNQAQDNDSFLISFQQMTGLLIVPSVCLVTDKPSLINIGLN